MKLWKSIPVFPILLLGAVLFSAKSCFAFEAKTKSLVAVEMLSGFSWGNSTISGISYKF